MILDIGTTVMIILGSLFIFIGSLGLIKLPDFFCRSHAVTKSSTLGISLLLIGSWLQLSGIVADIKIVAIIIFQFATIPLSGHLIGLISYKKNIKRWNPNKKESSNDNKKS